MATIPISIPDGAVQRVQDAFTAQFNYDPSPGGSPNPETTQQFTQRMIREYVKTVVASHEGKVAMDTAAAAARDAIG